MSEAVQGSEAAPKGDIRAAVTDVQIQPSWTRHRFAFTAAYGALLIVAVILLAGLINRGLTVIFVFAEFCVLGAVVVLYRLHSHGERTWQESLFRRPPLGEAAQAVHSETESGFIWDFDSVQSRLGRVTQRLAKAGHVGQTICLWWSSVPRPVSPIVHEFEPRMLDQTDPAFADLQVASRPMLDAATADGHSTHRSGVNNLRSFKRNLLVRGGWVSFALFGFWFIRAATEAFERRTITPWFALYVLALAAGLLALFKTSDMAPRQWLIVPGGLLRRTPRRGSTSSQLHIFTRAKSLLCLYQRGRKSWIVCVADGRECDTTVVTTLEMEMLLAAWFSPLPPPSVDRLADFW